MGLFYKAAEPRRGKMNERIELLLSLTYKVLTTSLPDYTILSLFSLEVEPAPHLLLPLIDHLYLPHYLSQTATQCNIWLVIGLVYTRDLQ